MTGLPGPSVAKPGPSCGKTRLYLHIGLHKTGSTAIQNFLRQNFRALLNAGFYYPVRFNSHSGHHWLSEALFGPQIHDLMDTAWDRSFNANMTWIDAIRGDLLAARAHSLILSSEDLSLLQKTPQTIAKLKTVLEDLFPHGLDIVIVIYLRRQDEARESQMRQHAKGHLADIGRFQNKKRATLLDYDAVYQTWSEVFAPQNITIIPYEGATRHDAVKPFVHACGMSGLALEPLAKRSNIALSRDALAYLASRPDLTPGSRTAFAVTQKLMEYCRHNPEPPCYRYLYSPGQRQEYLSLYAESNTALARKLGIFDGRLFRDPPPDRNKLWKPYPGLTDKIYSDIDRFVTRTPGETEFWLNRLRTGVKNIFFAAYNERL